MKFFVFALSLLFAGNVFANEAKISCELSYMETLANGLKEEPVVVGAVVVGVDEVGEVAGDGFLMTVMVDKNQTGYALEVHLSKDSNVSTLRTDFDATEKGKKVSSTLYTGNSTALTNCTVE